MPSWSSHPSFPCIGVKLVTHFTGNSSALNLLPGPRRLRPLDSLTGQPRHRRGATVLILYLTLASRALASELLSDRQRRSSSWSVPSSPPLPPLGPPLFSSVPPPSSRIGLHRPSPPSPRPWPRPPPPRRPSSSLSLLPSS
ncbi:hypothetical protein NL676_039332 [Syzygium grande]|nr:hypothetical protein NL676_039332 [Syzygium grande]